MNQSDESKPQLARSEPEAWLTVDEVAERLRFSRVYVSMLLRSGRLGEIAEGPDGSIQVRLSELEAYVAAMPKVDDGAATYQEIALDMGMYDIPESDYAGFRR